MSPLLATWPTSRRKLKFNVDASSTTEISLVQGYHPIGSLIEDICIFDRFTCDQRHIVSTLSELRILCIAINQLDKSIATPDHEGNEHVTSLSHLTRLNWTVHQRSIRTNVQGPREVQCKMMRPKINFSALYDDDSSFVWIS